MSCRVRGNKQLRFLLRWLRGAWTGTSLTGGKKTNTPPPQSCTALQALCLQDLLDSFIVLWTFLNLSLCYSCLTFLLFNFYLCFLKGVILILYIPIPSLRSFPPHPSNSMPSLKKTVKQIDKDKTKWTNWQKKQQNSRGRHIHRQRHNQPEPIKTKAETLINKQKTSSGGAGREHVPKESHI